MTYSIHIGSCRARGSGKLPDPACTPGSIDPAVMQRNIRLSRIDTWHHETNGSGYADVCLYARAGDRISVTAGAASCYTTAR